MAEEMLATLEKKKIESIPSTNAACRVETEIILPEYKGEAERIIRGTSKAVIKNKQVYLRDRFLVCEIEGSVGFDVLYQVSGDRSGKPTSFFHSENFTQSFQIPCNTDGLLAEEIAVFAEAAPRSSLVKLLGPRKLSAKCEVLVSLDVKCNQSYLLLSSECSDDLITRQGKVRSTGLVACHTEETRFSQTIPLPKAYLPIEEICEMEAVLFARNVKAEEGGVAFQGICDLHCSYTAEGENVFISFYQPIEFEKRVGIPELSRDHACTVSLTPVGLKATSEINEDGENKNVLFELDYVCEVNAFDTETVLFAEDAFSSSCQLFQEKKTETVRELLGIFECAETVKDKKPAKNSALLRAEGIRSGVDFKNTYMEDGRLCLEGKLGFSYLGVTEEDELKHLEDDYDFKVYVSPPFSIPEGEECSIEVCGGARGVDLEPDGEELRIRFDLLCTVSVYVMHRPEMVSRIERGEAFEKNRGEILYLYPEKGEDLWSLAKEYHVSPEKIKAQNHLSGEALPPYLKLIP